MFKFVGIEINENEEVVVYSPDYLKKMVDLILQTDKRFSFFHFELFVV